MWHRAGTISVNKGSTTVTGAGTGWVEGIRVGDGLQAPDGRMYEITNIASNTSLSITPAYVGATATNQTYWVIPVQGYVKRSADRLAVITSEIGDMPNDIADNKRRLTSAERTLGTLGTAATKDVTTSTIDTTAGRLLKAGDCGLALLMNASSGISDVDWGSFPNTYPYLGFVPNYIRRGDGAPPAGGANWHYLFQIPRASTGTCFQMAYPFATYSGAPIKFRVNTESPWRNLLDDANYTIDSNGFLKQASPIIRLYAEKITKTEHLEIEGTSFERVDVGHYKLIGCPELSRDGWYIETPKDRNGNIYFTIDYEEDAESGTLTVKTCQPDYSTGPAVSGDPVDILEGRFVALRFTDNPTLYPELGEEVTDEPAA